MERIAYESEPSRWQHADRGCVGWMLLLLRFRDRPRQVTAEIRRRARRLAGFSCRLADVLCTAVGVALCSLAPAIADECPDGVVGYMVTVQGTVEVSSGVAGTWQLAKLDTPVCMGEFVRVGPESRAGIYFDDIETVTYLDQNTTTRPKERPTERSLIFDLFEGAINFLTREPRSLEIRTPFVNAGVKGTEFEVRVELDRPTTERPSDPFSGRTVITLIEGQVAARTPRGTKVLLDGQTGEARGSCPFGLSQEMLEDVPPCTVPEGTESLRVYARPPNAVQWALYYPSITTDRATGLPSDLSEANRLLALGRVDQALPILCSPPTRGEKSALLAIVELTRNDPLRSGDLTDACGRPTERDNRQRAVDLAEQGVRMSPHSAAAWVSLSYARQASAQLEDAREALEHAVAADPQDALAQARLAEIWLSLGYRNKALDAADRARQLAPNLSRTQTVYGFAALADMNVDGARSAFTRAIRSEPTDALPRLGLGLAKIRNGEIAAGRREIEIAAGLDSQNPVIRSYLGKAYFEEKRSPLDAVQFDMAKALDSDDPTPWLYDAIRLETENRPVDALHAIQKSIELNDNRAVYRSQLQLDEDAAVRNTSLGRIYQDLGFDRLALVEGSKSLSYDPANYSAHRFLSDSYAALPRHELARSSEILQSQLLQPLNADPVQPQIAETDLNILAGIGPAEVGFNEFTPLFQHDGLRFSAAGIAGNQDTYGDEVVLSGIEGRTAFSVGQFHYQTDGFRSNNDVQHDIYDVFGQVALTESLDFQLEYKHRETEQGDLSLDFDPTAFSTNARRTLDQDSARVGMHYQPSPKSHFLASLIYADRQESFHQLIPNVIDISADTDDSGYDAEVQYLFSDAPFSFVAGARYSEVDGQFSQIIDFTPSGGTLCPPIPGLCGTVDDPTSQRNFYAYGNLEWPRDVRWTVGLAYDYLQEDPLRVEELDPKFGLQWAVTDKIQIRAAYLRTVKRAVVTNQTLEPTQVAGFNQLFDDINGAHVEQYGIGADFAFSDDLFGGVEFVRRELTVPNLNILASTLSFEDDTEATYRTYLYWAPTHDWSLAATAMYETFDSDNALPSDRPTDVNTFSAPVSIRYFNDWGLFFELTGTFIWQDVERAPVSGLESGDDNFFLLDGAIGYRLPERRGIVSIEAHNVLNTDFRFHDLNLQSSIPNNPEFVPATTILARLSLSF